MGPKVVGINLNQPKAWGLAVRSKASCSYREVAGSNPLRDAKVKLMSRLGCVASSCNLLLGDRPKTLQVDKNVTMRW